MWVIGVGSCWRRSDEGRVNEARHIREGERAGRRSLCCIIKEEELRRVQKDPDGISLFFCTSARQLGSFIFLSTGVHLSPQLGNFSLLNSSWSASIKWEKPRAVIAFYGSHSNYDFQHRFSKLCQYFEDTRCCRPVSGPTLSVCVVDLSRQRCPLVSKIVITYTKLNQ